MVSGGTTSIDTLSRKDIVATNALLVDSSFTELSSDEKKKRWKWGRASENVKSSKKAQQRFTQDHRNQQEVSIRKEEGTKEKECSKSNTDLREM